MSMELTINGIDTKEFLLINHLPNDNIDALFSMLERHLSSSNEHLIVFGDININLHPKFEKNLSLICFVCTNEKKISTNIENFLLH